MTYSPRIRWIPADQPPKGNPGGPLTPGSTRKIRPASGSASRRASDSPCRDVVTNKVLPPGPPKQQLDTFVTGSRTTRASRPFVEVEGGHPDGMTVDDE